MSSVSLPAVRHQSLCLSAPSKFAARLTNPWRSRNFRPLAGASIAALILSGCGGSDGSASSTDAVQADTTSPKFESFVSANPQVRATIQASPYGTKEDDLTGEEAERVAAAEDDASQDTASSGDVSAADSTSSGQEDDSAASSGASDADNADDVDNADDDSAASTQASGSLVDTLISDMSEMNDLPLKDVNPKYGFSRGPGYVLAGTNSGGANFLLPWFVQFEGEGNSASHTRVQIRNMRMFMKSRSTGEWSRLNDSDSFSGIQCDQGSNYFHCPQQAQVREDGESASTLPLSNLNLHGWWGGREPIEGWDVSAIVISLEARLVKDREDGVDDRAKAKYLLHVGGDYYPSDASQDRILEAVGVSRSKLVTNDWQTFALTTLNDVGLQEPGGGISSDELRADPPPME
jgi:hypothetical protein